MRATISSLAAAAAIGFAAMNLAACEEEGPAEQVGESMDEAGEEVGEALEESGEKLKESVE
ncbi:MAG TPA: hypothetical protein VIS03_06650 [Kiloniellaceae bacterium]